MSSAPGHSYTLDEAVVLRLLAAFTQGDRAVIEALIDPTCTWRVPGENTLAGTYIGRPAIMCLFRKLKQIFDAPAVFDVIDVSSRGDCVSVHQFGNVVVGGRPVRMRERLDYVVRNGRVTAVTEFQFDQAAFDRAFPVGPVDPALVG